MIIFKIILLISIVVASTFLGILFSKKYSNREKELKEMKNALNIFKAKIKFTYEPIPNIFLEISNKIDGNVGKIFERASNRMKEENAGDAWVKAYDDVPSNLIEEDIVILKNLGRLLGQTDIEGQLSQIEVTETFLNEQIRQAQEEKNKNEKLYSKLGVVIGLAIVIVLV